MDKYLENAFWMALENAVKDRSVESISRILDQMNAAKTMTPQMPSRVESKKPALTNKRQIIVEILVENGRLDSFLDGIKSDGRDSFSAKELRQWIRDQKIDKELDAALPEWKGHVGSAMELFYNESSPHYKGIALGDVRGHYKIVEGNPYSQLNGKGTDSFSDLHYFLKT